MLILNIEYSNQKKWFASSSVLLYFYPTELENDIKQRIIILNSDHRAVVGVKSDLLSDTRGGWGGNSAVQTVITKECHLLLRQHGIIKCVATLYYVVVATQHFIVKKRWILSAGSVQCESLVVLLQRAMDCIIMWWCWVGK